MTDQQFVLNANPNLQERARGLVAERRAAAETTEVR